MCIFLFGWIAFAGSTNAEALKPTNCLIEPEQVIKLATPVAGMVSEVLVDRGDIVKKGQVLARLDTASEEIALKLAQLRAEDLSAIASLDARADYLKSEVTRKSNLVSRNALPRAELREAEINAILGQRDLDEARLNQALHHQEVAQAKVQLENRILRSPIAGVVTERLLNPGEYWDGEAHIATIAKLDVLRVEAFVPISYIAHLKVGHVIAIRPEPPLDDLTSATIDVIDRVFDAATGTVGIRMKLDNASLTLPAGLRCQALF